MGDRGQDTVWEFDRPARSEDHPTMKPVLLLQKAIENSTTAGAVVYDCCGGSGSTLVACERTGRRCRTVEIDPHYADVIIRRYHAETGQEARLVA